MPSSGESVLARRAFRQLQGSGSSRSKGTSDNIEGTHRCIAASLASGCLSSLLSPEKMATADNGQVLRWFAGAAFDGALGASDPVAGQNRIWIATLDRPTLAARSRGQAASPLVVNCLRSSPGIDASAKPLRVRTCRSLFFFRRTKFRRGEPAFDFCCELKARHTLQHGIAGSPMRQAISLCAQQLGLPAKLNLICVLDF